MPMVIPTLTKSWKAIMAATPAASRAPNWSLDVIAMRSARQMMNEARAISRIDPANPVSSPMTVKMKSVWFSGT